MSEFIERINESVSIAKDNYLAAKTVQAHNANKNRRPEPEYKVGDKVMLDSTNIRIRIKKNGRSEILFTFSRTIQDHRSEA